MYPAEREPKMTVATIKKVNAAIAKYDVEMVKGTGYFYFVGLAGSSYHLDDLISSIYSNSLRDMSIQQYVDHVEDYLKT
jgi:hypothetical protein